MSDLLFYGGRFRALNEILEITENRIRQYHEA
jgi:hypothetical protein